MDEKELKALVSLLEDSDREVVTHVEERILSIGIPVIPFLEKEWEKQYDPIVQNRIEDLIHSLQFDMFKERLVQWKESGAKDLLEGMWSIATYQYPDLELEKLQDDLEKVYQEVWLDYKEDDDTLAKIKVINNVIFNRLKFTANTKNFHSPGNSMINIVLESKRGNPITLCAIYMLIGQKLGLPLYGVNLPNLFILVHEEKEETFYINVFNRGLIFTKTDIDNYISHLKLVHKDEFYKPCSNIDIVKRTLRNLIYSFEKLDEHIKAEEVKTLLHAISEPGEL